MILPSLHLKQLLISDLIMTVTMFKRKVLNFWFEFNKKSNEKKKMAGLNSYLSSNNYEQSILKSFNLS